MPMEAFLWMFLPVFVAGGTALLSFYIMQARMEVALAKERESLAEARAAIGSHKLILDEKIKATEEACKRQALDDFMHDIRIEERSYVRETKSLDSSRKEMVMQERLFFRNIPLSNWVEHQMVIEDGHDLTKLPKESIFGAASIAAPSSFPSVAPPNPDTQKSLAKLIEQTKPAEEAPPARVLSHQATAFGAQ